MSVLRDTTHPEVAVDPEVAVTRWGLSPRGRERAEALCRHPWVRLVTRVVSSDEVEAVQGAEVLAGHLGLPVEVREGIGENDRSATGYVPASASSSWLTASSPSRTARSRAGSVRSTPRHASYEGSTTSSRAVLTGTWRPIDELDGTDA